MAQTLAGELLQHNKQYTESGNHKPATFLSELKTMGGKPPRKIFIGCLDGRSNPSTFLSLSPREGFVFRNLGGHPQSLTEQILYLDAWTGPIEGIVIIHHTDCGMIHMSEEAVHKKLDAQMPENKAELDHMHFGTFSDIEGDLKKDLEWVKNNKLFRQELRDNVVGLMHDIKTGTVTHIA